MGPDALLFRDTITARPTRNSRRSEQSNHRASEQQLLRSSAAGGGLMLSIAGLLRVVSRGQQIASSAGANTFRPGEHATRDHRHGRPT